jgi:hypothetical protein
MELELRTTQPIASFKYRKSPTYVSGSFHNAMRKSIFT